MACQVLYRFRINTGMDQAGDIGVPQQMRCHIKVDAADNVFPIDAFLSRLRFEDFPDRLPVHILVQSSFLGTPNLDVIPDPNELGIRKRLPVAVCDHIIRDRLFLLFPEAIYKNLRDGDIPSGRLCLQIRINNRAILFLVPGSSDGDIRRWAVEKNAVPLQRQDLLAAIVPVNRRIVENTEVVISSINEGIAELEDLIDEANCMIASNTKWNNGEGLKLQDEIAYLKAKREGASSRKKDEYDEEIEEKRLELNGHDSTDLNEYIRQRQDELDKLREQKSEAKARHDAAESALLNSNQRSQGDVNKELSLVNEERAGQDYEKAASIRDSEKKLQEDFDKIFQ